MGSACCRLHGRNVQDQDANNPQKGNMFCRKCIYHNFIKMFGALCGKKDRQHINEPQETNVVGPTDLSQIITAQPINETGTQSQGQQPVVLARQEIKGSNRARVEPEPELVEEPVLVEEVKSDVNVLSLNKEEEEEEEIEEEEIIEEVEEEIIEEVEVEEEIIEEVEVEEEIIEEVEVEEEEEEKEVEEEVVKKEVEEVEEEEVEVEEDVCPTCFEEYTDENPKITTQCSHVYHLSCIYEWMERSPTCPICDRVMLFDE